MVPDFTETMGKAILQKLRSGAQTRSLRAFLVFVSVYAVVTGHLDTW